MQFIVGWTLCTVCHWLGQRLQGVTVLWFLNGVITADRQKKTLREALLSFHTSPRRKETTEWGLVPWWTCRGCHGLTGGRRRSQSSWRSATPSPPGPWWQESRHKTTSLTRRRLLMTFFNKSSVTDWRHKVNLNTCHQTTESFMNILASPALTSSELPWTHFFMAWENMEPKWEERGGWVRLRDCISENKSCEQINCYKLQANSTFSRWVNPDAQVVSALLDEFICSQNVWYSILVQR